MVTWSKIRELYPAADKFTYLNAAEGAPVSKIAAKEAKEFYNEMMEYGDTKWPDWLDKKEKVRAKVAKYINANPDEIAFTLNTSHGMNLITEMLKGRGNVLTMKDEFPSSTIPWLHRNYKVKFVEPENCRYTIENIEKSIEPETKILITSHVQYCTGFRQDLEALGKLCKKKNLIFIVNATQSMGVAPIDVKKANIDFLVFTSLKWVTAGYGIGVIYINKKRRNEFRYPFAGWLSVNNPEEMNNRNLALKEDSSELEIGTMHFPNIFALGGAIDLFNKIGKETVLERILYLDDYLEKKLTDIGAKIITPLEKNHRSGITIIALKNAQKTVDLLGRKKIIVSARGEGIRISCHIFNNKSDIDVFIKELQKII